MPRWWGPVAFVVILLAALAVRGNPAQEDIFGHPGQGYDKGEVTEIETDKPYLQYPSTSGFNRVMYFHFIEAEEHYADMEIHNELVNSSLTPETLTFVIDGYKFVVTVDARDGDAPDTFHLTVPPGFVALPPEITLEEAETGVMEIHRLNMF